MVHIRLHELEFHRRVRSTLQVGLERENRDTVGAEPFKAYTKSSPPTSVIAGAGGVQLRKNITRIKVAIPP